MATTTNYGFYSPPLTGVTPDVPRDMKTLADAVDAALKAEETARINATVRSSSAASCSTSTTLSTSAADMPGMTVSVTAGGTSSVFLVSAVLDTSVLSGGGGTLVGQLLVDGTAQPAQALITNPTSASRQSAVQTWLVTGLSAGAHTFKISASGTVASVYRINSIHSTLTVAQVS